MNENTRLLDIPLDATLKEVSACMPASNAPRFICVTDSDNNRHLISLEQIEHIDGSEYKTYLYDDDGNVIVRCVESVEQVAARIREVGGVVSSWGEGK